MGKETVVVVGLGLMGGSLALSIKESNKGNRRVIGIDRDSAVIEKALKMKAIDQGYTSLGAGMEKADLVVLALSCAETIKIAPSLAEVLAAGTVVTDMASTKQNVTETMEKILPPDVFFVPGHPMTGSEHQGIEAADSFLFENAAYVLTPTPKTSRIAIEQVTSLVKDIGGEVIILSPQKHDQIVAAVSHLPHLLAAALIKTIAKGTDKELALSLAAGSFRDATRVAVSPAKMWQNICFDNSQAILPYLREYRQQLEWVENAIVQQQKEELLDFFMQSKEIREQLPPRGKGFLTSLFDIVVSVKDTPGIIGEMAILLGKAGINIAEIEVLRVREMEEGSIRFAFKTLQEREKAVAMLTKAGIKAWNR